MSEELQRVLLGSVILNPPLFEDSDISALDFPEGKFRAAFRAAAKLWEDRRSVDPVILAEALGDNGGTAFVADLLGGMIKLQPAIFRDRLLELRRRRISTEIVRISQQLGVEHLKRGELDEARLDELKALIAKQDELLHSGRGKLDIASILKTSQAIRDLPLRVETVVEKLLYEASINLLSAPGGTGKTTLAFQLGSAIADGRPIFGLATKKKPVIFIDFENPLPLIKDRLERLGVSNLLHWTLAGEWPPPRLDSNDFSVYKEIPKDSVIIFDSLRASHSLDENSSQDMAIILNRLKELREGDRTIFVLHHSPKVQDRTFRGSGAIGDLSDHTLTLCRVKATTYEEIHEDLEPEPGQVFFFGCNGKSRFEKGHIYLTFSDTGAGFSLAEDPRVETLRAIADYIAGPGAGQNQSEIITWAKESGVGPKMRAAFIAVLAKGEKEGLWRSHKTFRGAKVYDPPSCS